MVRHSSKIFDYDMNTKTFSVDASNLFPVFGRIYPDAADEGFTMLSVRSGKEVKFVTYETHQNDGDVLGWKLKPTEDEIRKNPDLAGVTVMVFND